MIYPFNFETKTGFATVRKEIRSRCVSVLGEQCCDQMRFSSRLEEVRQWLGQTNEFLGILHAGVDFPVDYYFDMRATLKAIGVAGTHLSAESLFDRCAFLGLKAAAGVREAS